MNGLLWYEGRGEPCIDGERGYGRFVRGGEGEYWERVSTVSESQTCSHPPAKDFEEAGASLDRVGSTFLKEQTEVH